MGGLGKKQN